MSNSVKQVLFHQRPTGRPTEDTWKVVETVLPALTDGEFLVKVNFISLDPAMRGWLNDTRSYIRPVELGEVMRAHGTGQVVESKHENFRVGDYVVGTFGATEYAISDGKGVSQIDIVRANEPTYLGALGMPGMTAYFGLLDVGKLKEGDTVVVSGAAGAVGSVVGQLAKAKGARVIGIAGGPDKCNWLTDTLGFDGAIDYKNESVTRRLRELAPSGIDVFFDNVGGSILDSALANLALGARIVICGAISSYNESTLPPGPSRYMALLVFRASMTGFVVFDYADRYAEAQKEIATLISDGKLVAREQIVSGGVERFGSALEMLFDGKNTGKLVLAVD